MPRTHALRAAQARGLPGRRFLPRPPLTLPAAPRPAAQSKAKAYMQAVIDHKRCVPFLRYNGERRVKEKKACPGCRGAVLLAASMHPRLRAPGRA